MTVTTAPEPVVVDELITETADRLFGELCTHEAVQAAEEAGVAPDIWDAFCETGFDLIAVPEEAGGSGGTLAEAIEVLRLVGYHSAPIAAAENGILGGWLLAQAGIERPDGLVTVVPPRAAEVGWSGGGACSMEIAGDGTAVLNGEAHRVPWARSAELIVCVCDCDGQTSVVAVPASECEITPLPNMAGEPRDTVRFVGAAGVAAPAPDGVDAEALAQRGALSRVALMAGAIEKMCQLTVSYTNERVQFGRPVARFQAVQQHLVWAAQDAALVRMAAEVAAREATRGEAPFEIAAAKLIANQAAARATKACHQAHGAMGMTQEYPLHHFSRRLWSWRKEYGSDAHWSAVLGTMATAVGADGLYPLITSGTAALR
ncbi:acyl-CoA dehydrogenase family protein [Candidatus Poriferisodalis multihospitum]|uniref:acyl-CoA dehydrogenase family protein n=1 Tax=Candidatus Poriferisodalis multihospitum TaxID=2983191 RepID=UPI002B257AD5|nr:acyl-CoA dehydrogenase family protein [Candidatus Poriferisodalis multihospitum]